MNVTECNQTGQINQFASRKCNDFMLKNDRKIGVVSPFHPFHPNSVYWQHGSVKLAKTFHTQRQKKKKTKIVAN